MKLLEELRVRVGWDFLHPELGVASRGLKARGQRTRIPVAWENSFPWGNRRSGLPERRRSPLRRRQR